MLNVLIKLVSYHCFSLKHQRSIAKRSLMKYRFHFFSMMDLTGRHVAAWHLWYLHHRVFFFSSFEHLDLARSRQWNWYSGAIRESFPLLFLMHFTRDSSARGQFHGKTQEERARSPHDRGASGWLDSNAVDKALSAERSATILLGS